MLQMMNQMNGNRRACGANRGNTRYVPMERSDRGGMSPWLRLENDAVQGVTDDNHSGCGCGCNGNEDNASCRALLEKLRLLDFSLCELVLYLDAHPTSCEALEMYHKLLCQRKELLDRYEAACGPLTVGGNHSHTSWDWFKGPFPWEYEAN